MFEKKYYILSNDNNMLRAKLENVESIFIQGNLKKKKKSMLQDDYMINSVSDVNVKGRSKLYIYHLQYRNY